MNSKSLASYGTEFEEPEDPTRVGGLKKPTPIQEQIATDWKGRRRFHGAFTGGFSAGYFNSVGSKHGWVPQEFKSSREQKFDGDLPRRVEDYMDEEDLGEFGISARRIQQTDTFAAGSSVKVGEKRRLAWEHEDPLASGAGIASALMDVVKPVSNSIGYRMLRSMGWREGRGVGLATTKQTRERGGSSKSASFDREQAAKVAPGHSLAQEDVLIKHLQAEEGLHGLGYQGLRQSTALDEKLGFVEAALKTKKNKKGIRGQAFGVGAFEEEDESVYTQFDLTQYDFSLDVTGRGGEGGEKAHKVDATFEETPKRQNPRKFFLPPKLPPNFKPEHKSASIDTARLPNEVRKAMQAMTADQRAKLLGEDRIVLAEALAKQQRGGTSTATAAGGERRREGRSRWDQKTRDAERKEEPYKERIAFPNEPLKQQRFKEYLHYLKRGLPFPKPTDMTVWEWEAEKKDFEAQLTNEERALLPEVRSRSQPLAKSTLAAPILELMANKFTKETGTSGQGARRDEDKMAAIKLGLFGEKTRTQFTWYPDNTLAKRFNVPNPYPAAGMVGCPALQKASKREDIVNLGLPNTAIEMAQRHHRVAHGYDQSTASKSQSREPEKISADEIFGETEQEVGEKQKIEEAVEKEEKKEERPPEDVFAAIFGDLEVDDSDSEKEISKTEKDSKAPERRPSSSSSSEDERSKKKEKTERIKEDEEEPEIIEVKQARQEKVLTVMDIEDEYGPAPPTSADSAQQGLTGFSVLKFLKEEMETRKKKKKRDKNKEGKQKKKKSKKEKRSRHAKRKNKKEKREKKEKKRHHSKRSSSSSDGDSESDESGSASPSESSYEEAK